MVPQLKRCRIGLVLHHGRVSFCNGPDLQNALPHPQTGPEASRAGAETAIAPSSRCGEPGSAASWHPRPRLSFGAGEMRHQDHGRGRLATRDTTRPFSPRGALLLDSGDLTHRARAPDRADETVRRAVESHLSPVALRSSSLWARARGRRHPQMVNVRRAARKVALLPQISAFESHPSQRLTDAAPPHAGITSGTRRVLDNHPFLVDMRDPALTTHAYWAAIWDIS